MSSVVQAMNPNGRKVQIFLELRHPYQSGNKLRISITINKGSNCVHSRDPERLHRRVRCVWKPWILFASCEINLTATTYDYAVRYKFRFIYLVHIWRTYFNWCNGIFLDACQHSINEYILYDAWWRIMKWDRTHFTHLTPQPTWVLCIFSMEISIGWQTNMHINKKSQPIRLGPKQRQPLIRFMHVRSFCAQFGRHPSNQ